MIIPPTETMPIEEHLRLIWAEMQELQGELHHTEFVTWMLGLFCFGLLIFTSVVQHRMERDKGK